MSSSNLPDGYMELLCPYILGCPAIGASAISKGFIVDLKLINSAAAEIWIGILDPNHKIIRFVENAEMVESYAEDHKNELFNDDEYYICTRTEREVVKNAIESLPEYQSSLAGPVTGEKVADLVKRRFFEVDSVYRHLRNALAHGCFKPVVYAPSGTSEERLFFFDKKSDGKLTAIGLLSLKTLSSWYTKACNQAQKRL